MVEKLIESAEETVENLDGSENERKAMPVIDSKYRMILLAAQRAKQLQRGAHARVDLDPKKHKNTRIALKEIEAKRIHFETTEN